MYFWDSLYVRVKHRATKPDVPSLHEILNLVYSLRLRSRNNGRRLFWCGENSFVLFGSETCCMKLAWNGIFLVVFEAKLLVRFCNLCWKLYSKRCCGIFGASGEINEIPGVVLSVCLFLMLCAFLASRVKTKEYLFILPYFVSPVFCSEICCMLKICIIEQNPISGVKCPLAPRMIAPFTIFGHFTGFL